MTSFPQWMNLFQFQQKLFQKQSPPPKYVILISTTPSFQIYHDLKVTLGIKHFPLPWFIARFREHRVQVEYLTLFSRRDQSVLGPIAKQVSEDICLRLLKKKYSEKNTIMVCSPSLKCLLERNWQLKTFQEFTQQLLLR